MAQLYPERDTAIVAALEPGDGHEDHLETPPLRGALSAGAPGFSANTTESPPGGYLDTE